MKLSDFKKSLDNIQELNFLQLNGTYVPKHFHITEAGLSTKHFIDCGGTIRTEKVISFQLWVAQDIDHRLQPNKLKTIIGIAEPLFGGEDLEIEIEFQNESISRFGLDFNGKDFIFTAKKTDCLAKDHCGIPPEKMKIKLSELQKSQTSCCTPDSGCC